MKKLMMMAVMGLTVAACSRGNNGDIRNAVDPQVNETGLMSTWKAECRNLPLDLLKLSSQQDEYRIENDIRHITTIYGTDNCTEATVKVEEVGSYGNFDSIEGGNHKIDINWKTVKITPLSDAGRDLMNNVSFCGTDQWVTNEERDVTADTSNHELLDRCWTKTPRDQYDIVRIEGNKLQWGQSGISADRSTPEQRPTSIDTSVTYTK
ncbi:MAG: hypothetical protein KF802_00620 [Bdellovibrionaceae bacterium]|nr:hypothetical protein [Pseudobdellovibrionaceae bacterium]